MTVCIVLARATPIKLHPVGAVQDAEGLFELAREWMEVSKLKKLPGHVAKENDVSLWKQYSDRVKKKSGVRIRAFRCLLKHRTGFCAGIRIQYGPD